MGWGPCIFRLLTVNLLTLPIFQPISMLFDRELIEMGDKKLSLSFFNTFRASDRSSIMPPACHLLSLFRVTFVSLSCRFRVACFFLVFPFIS